MNNYLFALDFVKRVARNAGHEILRIYENPELMEVSYKSDESPLTQADTRSNQIIVENLAGTYPEIPIISEENSEIPYETRRAFEFFWLVDPLDGTKEFIQRTGDFSVNIALIHNGKSVLGVVYAPVSDALYWAAEGVGAFVEHDGERRALEVAGFYPNQAGLNVVCSRSHPNPETDAFIAELPQANIVEMGGSLKFMQIAGGQAHLYPRFNPKMMEWDVAANQIIVEEAGGEVLDWESQTPIRYNKPSLRMRSFMVRGRVKS